MYSFRVTLHARPAHCVEGGTVALAGQTVRTLAVRPDELAATTFDCSFETAIERLSRLERMYCEPDGSFVWTSSHGELAWQVDGNLFDRAGRLLFVDLKGCCPCRAVRSVSLGAGLAGKPRSSFN